MCCLFFFDIRILVTHVVSFGIVLSVLLRYTDSGYPCGIFWHCVVCSSSIYGFWLPLWYLLALCCLFFFDIRILVTPVVSFGIVLSVLLRYTDSGYPCGIFWHCVVCSSSIYGFWLPLWYLLALCCLFFFDIRILVTPVVSFGIVLSVLLRYTDSGYPCGIFWHCVVCSSSIYGFWLPLWYLLALCCLFFFDIRILVTPVVSFGIVLSVLLRYTDSGYPCGIFWHCVVCSSSIYGFWLPLWYLLALCCLFFFDIRILVTPVVSFGIVLSVLLRYTDSGYPCGIFWHCVVCSSSIYGFWLPLWYLLALCCLFFFDIRILVTPVVSFGIVLSVLLRYTDSGYPCGIFWHCVVCSSSIYGFWLPLWYLLALCCLFFFDIRILVTPVVSFGIVLSVLLRYTDSGYPCGIFWHCVVCSSSIYGFWLPLWYLLALCCLFFFDIRILVTPVVSFGIVLSVLLRYTDSGYPCGIFWHCVVCSSSIYGFWLPLWYLLALCCLFFFDIRILVTPVVSFGIVLSVLLRYTDSGYPCGIFWHCVVCSSSIYGFWLPLWYLLALCCLFFFDIRILVTPVVSFGIVLSVLLRYTDSGYPCGIFWHCVVCSSSIYGFWLPLWYLLALCCLFFFDIRILALCCLFFFDIRILVTPVVSFGIVLSVLLRYTDSGYPCGIFWHCVVCSSSIYGFWLPLWYTPVVSFGIVLSVLLRYTDSGYPCGIFWHCVVCSSSIYGFWLPLWYLLALCCLFFFDIRILVTPVVSFGIVLSVLLRYTDSGYPCGIFWHCVVCSSSIYGFWLPLWYLLALCCLFFFDIRILVTPVVSFGIVLSVLLRYTDSGYPCGIFWHCVVCSSSIYGFWLPLWYLLALCCLFFFDIRILVTPVVSFGIVLSVLLRYTDSGYPCGIFWHCVVCSSSIYGFWLPLWYLLALCCLFFFDIRILVTPVVSFGIVLSVLLRYTDSGYPCGIFWHCVVCSSSIYGFWLPLWYLLALCCLFFFDIRILITPVVSFGIVLSVLLRYTDSGYPCGIFWHCVVCSSSIYGFWLFWLPLWYLLALCCLFFFDIRILVTPVVSFGIVLSVLLRYTDSGYPCGIFWHCVVCSSSIYGYPCGIFWHCVVCSSSIYGFWLPLWYLLALCCLFFFDIRILVTPVVSFGIVLSVLLRYTDSDYPCGIFWHCVVCSSSIYGFWLPLWYLLALCCLFFFDIRILITPVVSFGIVLSVLLRYTDSGYPCGIFWHCVVCSSSIYGF